MLTIAKADFFRIVPESEVVIDVLVRKIWWSLATKIDQATLVWHF